MALRHVLKVTAQTPAGWRPSVDLPRPLAEFWETICRAAYIFDCPEAQELIQYTEKLLEPTHLCADDTEKTLLIAYVRQAIDGDVSMYRTYSDRMLLSAHITKELNLMPQSLKDWPSKVVSTALKILGPDWHILPEYAPVIFKFRSTEGRVTVIEARANDVKDYPLDFL